MSRIKHTIFLVNKKVFSFRILVGLSKIYKKKVVLAEFNLRSSNEGQQITLVNDKVILPYLAKYGVWDQPTSDFFARNIQRLSDGSNTVFIDVGANQGLVSRQVNERLNELGFPATKIFFELIEPNPLYLYAAIRNTSNIKQVRYLNFALVVNQENGIDKISDSTLFFTSYNASATMAPNTLYNMNGKIDTPSSIPIISKSCASYLQNLSDRHANADIFIKSDTDGNCLKILREVSSDIEFFQKVKAFEVEINFEIEMQVLSERNFILDLASKYSEVNLIFKHATYTGTEAFGVLKTQTIGAANLQCAI